MHPMRALLRGSCFLLISHLLTGCLSTYAPPGPVVPLLNERGDVSVGANVRPVYPARGANAYVAAAPTESTRLYVAGSIMRHDGRRTEDMSERSMRERNHTTQVEAAFGWGAVHRRMIFEAFGGLGYGTSRANACERNTDINGDYGMGCMLWINSKSWFIRPFVQAEFGALRRLGGGGGGVRVSAVRYDFERLMGEPSDRAATAVIFETFGTARFGVPWGKLELTALLPFTVSSPQVSYTWTYDAGYAEPRTQTFTRRLIDTASPRLTLGLRADLDELWRKRKR